MRRNLWIFLILTLLTGCTVKPAETTVPTTVPASTPATDPAPTEDLSDTLRTGYYLLTGYSDDETTVDGFAMINFRGYLQINPDRTGLLCMNGLTEHIDWTPRYLIISGGTCKFTIKDDVMTLNYNYLWEGTFTYCGDEIPDYYLNPAPEPAMYLLTHYIDDDQIYAYDNPDAAPAYIHLRPDGTAVYFNGKEEYNLTWENDTLLLSSSPLPYRYYSADQTEDGIATLVIYNLGYDMVIFRALGDRPTEDF